MGKRRVSENRREMTGSEESVIDRCFSQSPAAYSSMPNFMRTMSPEKGVFLHVKDPGH